MQFILNEISNILKNSDIGKELTVLTFNELKKEPSFEKSHEKKNSSMVVIDDNGFDVEEIGVGGGFKNKLEERIEELTCDGKTVLFTLKEVPIRPIIEVNIQNEKLIESDDYNVNYKNKQIIFRNPPKKGKDNLVIRYLSSFSTGEIRSLKMKINCVVDIWSKNLDLLDDLVVSIIKTIMIADGFENRGIIIKLLRGTNLSNDFTGDLGHYKQLDSKTFHNLFGKRLYYQIENIVEAEISRSRIEEIKIKSLDF